MAETDTKTATLVGRLVPKGSVAHRVLRRLKRMLRRRYDSVTSGAVGAYVWRSLMIRTTVIAITGSVGKSTCRELLYGILSARSRTHKTPNNENDQYGVPRVLLRMRPWHRFAVIEVAASGPGTMRWLAKLVRPNVAIITTVARTHTNRYNSIDAIASEKAELLRYLKPGGLAILNGDDDRVVAMREISGHPAILFGTRPGNDFVASDIQARWPDRLSLTVSRVHAGEKERQSVRTNLVGEHWVSSVLGALAAAHACGMDMKQAVAAIRRVPPFRARMQPVRLPNGAVMVRDENGSVDVLKAMLKVAASARARRRIIVLGDITDSGISKAKKRLAMAGTLVVPDVDAAVFVGRASRHAAHAAIAAGLSESSVFSVQSIRQAADLLARLIEPGDLVFVKGLTTQHLSRLVFSQLGTIGCWVDRCTIRKDCDICPRLEPSFDLGRALR